jgi:hypothetical protein
MYCPTTEDVLKSIGWKYKKYIVIKKKWWQFWKQDKWIEIKEY